MIALRDGRRLGVRRNGFSFVAILDDRQESHTIDFVKAIQLAEALESGSNIGLSTSHGRVLALQHGTVAAGPDPKLREVVWALGDTVTPRSNPLDESSRAGLNPQVLRKPRGPWLLDDEGRVKLAAEIRAAINNGMED